jgi:hypothetical protein
LEGETDFPQEIAEMCLVLCKRLGVFVLDLVTDAEIFAERKLQAYSL